MVEVFAVRKLSYCCCWMSAAQVIVISQLVLCLANEDFGRLVELCKVKLKAETECFEVEPSAPLLPVVRCCQC